MAQVGTPKGEAAQVVLEALEKARQQAERSRDWKFPLGSSNTLSQPKTSKD